MTTRLDRRGFLSLTALALVGWPRAERELADIPLFAAPLRLGSLRRGLVLGVEEVAGALYAVEGGALLGRLPGTAPRGRLVLSRVQRERPGALRLWVMEEGRRSRHPFD